MQLINVLAFQDGVYILVKCKCGIHIKQKRSIYRVTCPDCQYSVLTSELKDLKHE